MLEPCPFCQGGASLQSIALPIQADCADIYVQCGKCDAVGPTVLFDYDNHSEDDVANLEAEAIAAWNARTPPASQSDEAREECIRKEAFQRGFDVALADAEAQKAYLAPPASQSDDLQSRVLTYDMHAPSDEALVEELVDAIRDQLCCGASSCARAAVNAILPNIRAREAAAREERFLSSGVIGYKSGFADGRREGIEEAAKIAQSYGDALTPADGWSAMEKTGFETGVLDCAAAIAAAIRSLKEKQHG